jgi:hypothetical protein
MGRDITEYIDEYVEDNYGHTNWGYASTYSLQERKDKSQYELELNGTILVWYAPLEEE